ncbi:transcription initiation factor TFIID subunit 4b-like isoform X2 [Magnolia sinica]|uniref:transcription initiation factor TFIID subunit 4b-like isoform X2 n=1 Tax=Magnolia sinica TaxID=86752 RepID=UPI0026584086|nr:transcription initiation factor TFIID subunit 4b-like isoform X2 [Magnolia sinica]
MLDESTYSGADVDAFTAALNRDIGGDTSNSQLADSDSGMLAHGSNPTANQLIGPQQTSNQEENLTHQHHPKEEHHHLPPQGQHTSETEQIPHGSTAENQHQQNVHSTENDQLPLQQKQSQDDQQHRQTEQNNNVQISEQIPVQRLEQDKFQQSEIQHQLSKLPQLNKPAQAADRANNPMVQNRSPINISIGMLIPVLCSHLDKDRAMQLQTIFTKLRQNEVGKEDFLRVVRNIVGDQMLRQAADQVQMQYKQKLQAEAAQNSQTNRHQYQLRSKASPQQQTTPSSSSQQFIKPQSFPTQHQNQSQIPSSAVPIKTEACFPIPENSGQKSREMEHQIPSANMKAVSQERDLSAVSLQAINKQPQQPQQLHLPPTSFPMYGGAISNFSSHAYSGPSVSSAATSIKTQNQDSQMRKVPHLQGMVSTQPGATQPMNLMNMPKYEQQNTMNDPKRLHSGPISHLTGHSGLQQNPMVWQSSFNKEQQSSGLSSMPFQRQETADHMANQQHKTQLSAPLSSSSFGMGRMDQVNPGPGPPKDENIEKQPGRMGFPTASSMIMKHPISSSMATQLEPTQTRSQIPSATTPAGSGSNARTPPKKSSVGQKKPLEALGTPSPLSSKKQKASSGALLDQSIEQLNDVTAVSGVNLKEEEEQLLSAPKEESRASEASRRVVQEEEERLILQKGPLQKKIAEIMSKCGVKSIGNDVERCLSLCVEERMRGLIGNLIRISKQRVDVEKPRHRIFITSDVRRQILMMNRKAKEDWDKKQAEEAEKLRKNNETEGNLGAEVDKDKDKDKDEGRLKAPKPNKEEDDKMRTTAANVAARAAVGGDDMLSKWQLMAEQARLKREGIQDGASSGSPGKDPSRRPLSASGKTSRDNQEVENKGPSAGSVSGAIRKFGRNQVIMPQTKVARSISIKDVVAVLEREPQMSRSTLIYRLYERMHGNAVPE